MARNLSEMQIVIGANSQGVTKALQQVRQNINQTFTTVEVNKFTSSASKLRDILSDLGFSVAKAGAAGIGAALVSATKSAVTFESAMADVKKVVAFDGAKEFDEMGQAILNLSTKIPIAADGIAQIVAAGGQANIPKEELLGFAESAAKMGVAFDITADQAGEMMAKWRTAFGYGQDEVVALADQVNYLGNTTSAGTGPISEVVTRIGALGGVSGVSSANIAALAASVAGTGQPAEIAATGIKNLMLALTKGEAATKSQKDAFASLGLSATDVAQKMQVDAKSAILEVLTAISKLDVASQSATLTKIFGSESVSAIAPLLSQLPTLQENFEKVGNSALYAGSMQDEFAARSETTENQLTLLKNSTEAVAINIGSVFLPMIASAAQYATAITQSFAEWAGQNKDLVSTLGTVATALVAVKTASMGLRALQSVAASYYESLVASSAKEVALTQTTEAEKTAIQERAIAKRMAIYERLSIKEQQEVAKRVMSEGLGAEETTAKIVAETAKIQERYAAVATQIRNAMVSSFEAQAVAATNAGTATVAAQTEALAATERTTVATTALAEAQTAQGVAATRAGAATVAAQGEALVATERTTAATAMLAETHTAAGTAAAGAGARTVSVMGTAATAVGRMTQAVWALAGGWMGVAVAIGYAAVKLAEFYSAKAQEKKANTYTLEGRQYSYDPDKNEWHTDTTDQKRDTVASQAGMMGNGQNAGAANAMLSIFSFGGEKTKVDDAGTINDLEWLRNERAKEAEGDIDKKLDDLQGLMQGINVGGTIDIPAMPDIGTGGGGGTVGGSSTSPSDDDITRKLAEAQKKAERLKETMKEAISANTDTSYMQELVKHKKDMADKTREIQELQEAGLDSDRIEELKTQLQEYGTAIEENIQKKWQEAYDDMVTASLTATAEASYNYEAMAEASYQATLTQLNRERKAKEKELMQDENDWQTKATISDWYYAKVKKAEEDLSKARRDAHRKHISYLQEQGDYIGIRDYLRSDEGSGRETGALKLEGQTQLAQEYTKIWQEAHKDVTAYLAEASSSVYSTLSDSLTDFINGTKSAKDVFSDFTNSVLNMMAKIASQKLAASWMENILGNVMGGTSSKSSSSSGYTLTSSLFKFSTGGHITGAGSSTSDSIPAMLSNGEYVIKAATVAKLGVPFLDRLNQTASVAQRAKGGIVTAPTMSSLSGGNLAYIPVQTASTTSRSSSSGVTVNITNKSDSQVQVESSSYDEGLDSYILNVVIDGASRNKGGFTRNLKTALGG